MSWLKNLSARAKLMLAFLVTCAILSSVAVFALYKMSTINSAMNTMYSSNLVPMSALGTAHVRMVNVGRTVRTAGMSDNPAVIEKYRASVDVLVKDFDKFYTVVEHNADNAKEQAMTAKIRDASAKYFERVREAFTLLAKGEKSQAAKVLSDAKQVIDTVDQTFDEEAAFNEQQAEVKVKASDNAYRTSFGLVITLIGVGATIGISAGWLISRWFAKALTEVGLIADSVAAASHQLAAAAEELSSGAQEQASSLEETASSLEEITGTIQQNADNAQQANQLAGKSREVAEKGGDVVSRAVQGMNEINASSRKIADIITAIDEIAFQTNLLALNAAVEAARAGEQGRGFAVVAGEVRNLAQRSAGAAKEIKGLIQDSVSKVETGSKLVNQSGETLHEIVTSVKRVTDIVSEIAAASREQAGGIDQVNKAVTQMDQVTQGNASQTEELSGTAESLAAQAMQLQNVVAQFHLAKQSSTAPTAARSTAPARRTVKSRPATAKKKPAARPVLAGDDLENRVEQELQLLGAGVSGNGQGGFEEF
jgi:methyl-accepting chemotaxis protein